MRIGDLFRARPGRAGSEQSQIRCAQVYRRSDKYFVTASSRTRDGFWLEDGPVSVASTSDSDALAAVVRAALERSRIGIPAPHDLSAWISPVAEAAGYKRYTAFAKGTALVSIEQTAGRLRIKPSRNAGSREGYLSLEDRALDIAADAPNLGQSIEEAFDRCA